MRKPLSSESQSPRNGGGVTMNPLPEAVEPDPGQSSGSRLGEDENNPSLNPDSAQFSPESDEDEEMAFIKDDLTGPNLEGSECQIIITYQKWKREGKMKKARSCICTICHEGFLNQQLLQLHMSNVHSDKRPYHCSHCGKGFATSTQLTVHERIHDPNRFKGEPKYQCDLCDNKYHLKVSLDSHRKWQHLGYKPPIRRRTLTQHHSVGVRNEQRPKKDVQVFNCPLCDLNFGMKCMMRKHLRCHIGEKPYQCQECKQRFVTNAGLQIHLRNRHLNPSNKPRPSRPSFMYRQPCPCTFCGKVFRVPSHLQIHILTHIGERPHECGECGESFRIPQGLRIHRLRKHEIHKGQVNELAAYKCRICGKDGMMWFSDFRNHRGNAHRHIPFDAEQEKSYGCGICGKPYYMKGQAIVCALLKHDPSTLLHAMFKFKCQGCPEDTFGHHSTIALRRHWEKDHPDKPLPVRYRVMYNRRDQQEDILPKVRINQEMAKRIQANGPMVKSEFPFPLYTEFGLLPVKHKFYEDFKKSMTTVEPTKLQLSSTCQICEKTLSSPYNLQRHLKLHDRSMTSPYNCSLFGKRFRKLKTLGLHERHVKWTAGGCTATRRDRRSLRKGFKAEAGNRVTVNINDSSALRTILGNRVAYVSVSRVATTNIKSGIKNINNCKDETASLEALPKQHHKYRQSKEGSEGGASRINLNKMLSIVLTRVDD